MFINLGEYFGEKLRQADEFLALFYISAWLKSSVEADAAALAFALFSNNPEMTATRKKGLAKYLYETPHPEE